MIVSNEIVTCFCFGVASFGGFFWLSATCAACSKRLVLWSPVAGAASASGGKTFALGVLASFGVASGLFNGS